MERTNALNPYAQPWVPMLEKVREEDRTIFFTFSRGHPVSNHQIAQFFTRNFGDCIQMIYVHRPNPKRPPLFGKLVFSKCYVPAIIFGDQEEKHFRIDNKSVWCKRYKKKVGCNSQHN